MSVLVKVMREFRDLKAAGKPIRKVGDEFAASPERVVELGSFVRTLGEYVPTASEDAIGGVKVDGTTVTISDGVISAVMPKASSETLGAVKVDGTTIVADSDGVISVAPETPETPDAEQQAEGE